MWVLFTYFWMVALYLSTKLFLFGLTIAVLSGLAIGLLAFGGLDVLKNPIFEYFAAILFIK